jgi:hypothetical protein
MRIAREVDVEADGIQRWVMRRREEGRIVCLGIQLQSAVCCAA